MLKCCTFVVTEKSIIFDTGVSNKYLHSVSYTYEDVIPVGKKANPSRRQLVSIMNTWQQQQLLSTKITTQHNFILSGSSTACNSSNLHANRRDCVILLPITILHIFPSFCLHLKMQLMSRLKEHNQVPHKKPCY